jgi:hypothetical protein
MIVQGSGHTRSEATQFRVAEERRSDNQKIFLSINPISGIQF